MAKSYLHTFWHVTFGGELYTNGEDWVCGYHIANPTSDMIAPAQGHVDAIASAFQTLFTNGTMAISNAATLQWARISHLDTAGKAILADTVVHTYSGTIAGASATPVPSQIALAVSFKASTVPKGPGSNGRMYLPVPNHNLTPAGVISSTDIANMLPVLQTFFNASNTETFGDGGVVALVGAANPARSELAVTAEVNTIRLSNVLATVRKRGEFKRSYQSTTVTP